MRSLTNNLKIHFILHTLKDSNVDIACITETWLSPELGHEHTISIIKKWGYNIAFEARKNRTGGGVAFVLKPHVKYVALKHYNDYVSFECHGIKVTGDIASYRFLCIYRKQEVSMRTFLDEFLHFMESFCSNTTDEIVLLGDFNVHFGSGDKKSTDLADVVHQYGMVQTVNGATRISGYTLDLVFSNPHSLPLLPEVAEDLAETHTSKIKFDHFPIIFSINDKFETNQSPGSQQYQKYFRKINQIDSSALNELLQMKLSTELVDVSDGFSTQLDIYNKCLASALDELAPMQVKTVALSSEVIAPPWMDAEYRKQRCLRRRYEKQWKRLGTAESKTVFIKQRDYCAFLANNKIKMFYSNLSSSTDNQTTLFKKVAQLWNRRKTKALPEKYTDFKILADDFNTFFSNKVDKIRDTFNSVDTTTEIQQVDSTSSSCLDDFDPASYDELKEVISDMDIKTCFDDPLPAPLVKSALPILLPHILKLVNLSLSTGDISGLKESDTTPILKKALHRPIVT